MSTEPWWPGEVPPNSWADGAPTELKFGTTYPDDYNASHDSLLWSNQWDPWNQFLGAPYRFYPSMGDKWVPGGSLSVAHWYGVVMKSSNHDPPAEYQDGAFDGRPGTPVTLRVDVKQAGGCEVRLGLCSSDFTQRVYSGTYGGFPGDIETVTTCGPVALTVPDEDIWKPAWPFLTYHCTDLSAPGQDQFKWSEFHATGIELFWLPWNQPQPQQGPPGTVRVAGQGVGHFRL